MKEALPSFETSALIRATRRTILEDAILHFITFQMSTLSRICPNISVNLTNGIRLQCGLQLGLHWSDYALLHLQNCF
jgi:hypothetical protein